MTEIQKQVTVFILQISQINIFIFTVFGIIQELMHYLDFFIL